MKFNNDKLISIHLFIILFNITTGLVSCSGKNEMSIKLTSTAFEEGETIPEKYTCDGENISPPFNWENIPPGTESVALISDDPDAPVGTWVHWVIYNIPPDINKLPENMPTDKILSYGASQGKNDWGKVGYGGPCPPSGTHRYFFKIYALDTVLELKPGSTKELLLRAMHGHIISEGKLTGKYKRS